MRALLSLDEYFAGQTAARDIFEAVYCAAEGFGQVDLRVTKSQVALTRKKAFAWVWMPGKYLFGKVAPLVLTLSLRRTDASPRWKQIVEPVPGRYTHHLELYAPADVDDEVVEWLREAWDNAD